MKAPTTIRSVMIAALGALVVGLSLLALLDGFSPDPAVKTLEVLAIAALGAMIIGGSILLAIVNLADWRLPESDADFDLIVERAEALAARGSWGETMDEDYDSLFGQADPGAQLYGRRHSDHAEPDDAEFRALVRSAIDELPIEFAHALEHIAIVVSDGGAAVPVGNGKRGAYGLYQGDTIARDYFHDRIVIFRDTLVRDFGHDPDRLRDEVVRTVRHELAHHLGFGEDGVRGLGL